MAQRRQFKEVAAPAHVPLIDEWLPISRAAPLINIAPWTLRRILHQGAKIKVRKLTTAKWLINRDDLFRWAESVTKESGRD